VSYSRRVRDLGLRWGPVLGHAARSRLRNPLFLVGFNKSGKSMLVEGLAQQPGISVFPGEGNESLWFRGFYPWVDLDVRVPPLWFDPDAFVRAVVASRRDGFLDSRAQLGLFQALRAPFGTVVNDSGMLAALLPDIVPAFPDAKVIHMVRDGRVVSHTSAQKTLLRIGSRPERYAAARCPADPTAVLEAQASLWCWTLDRVAAAATALPDAVLQVRYEDWCRDPDGVLGQIVDFSGSSRRFHRPVWDARIENHNEHELSRISHADLKRVEAIQADHLHRFGYISAPGA
jgi:hypothetical protein